MAAAMLALAIATSASAAPAASPEPLQEGRCALQQGQVRLALAPLEQALAAAAPGEPRARAAAALG
ncbi:MAG: hypothetical protein L6Q73_20700, partial [Aquabacterium sp.]|nr:hypothetical protein [Aquabacterium sp.]